MKWFKRTRHGGLTKVSQAKRRNNMTAEVSHGQRQAAGALHEIKEVESLQYRHDRRRSYMVSCPQCRLLLGHQFYLFRRVFLRAHFAEHRLHRALGIEAEWVAAHVSRHRWFQTEEKEREAHA